MRVCGDKSAGRQGGAGLGANGFANTPARSAPRGRLKLRLMSKRPTGPEDPTPGPEVTLNADQFEALLLFVPKKHQGEVRLTDRGELYVRAELLDPSGNVTKSRFLYPLGMKHDTPAARRRWVRERNAESEEERATRSEQEQPPG
jgi:hypothetical protein